MSFFWAKNIQALRISKCSRRLQFYKNVMLTMLAEAAAADEDKKENGLDQKDCIRYNYGIVVESDIPEEAKQREMMDICQIACEKYAAAEKSPLERDNQAAAEMIKTTLDNKMNGPYNVIVGESFSIEIDYVQKTLLYMYFGGYLAILVWKCV